MQGQITALETSNSSASSHEVNMEEAALVQEELPLMRVLRQSLHLLQKEYWICQHLKKMLSS